MQQVYEDCRGANKDVGEQRGVDFPQVARVKAILVVTLIDVDLSTGGCFFCGQNKPLL